MHRCYISESAAVGQTVTLSPEESAHAARVMRLRKGDAVELLDGENAFSGEIALIDKDCVRVLITRELPSPEPRVRMTLYQGLPKAGKLETIAQKAVELGVYRVVPVIMERCVARRIDGKAVRLRRIALEAAKQAGRARVPEIADAISFARLCESAPAHGLCLVAWEEEKRLMLSRALKDAGDASDIAFVIGPEGGIAPREAEALREAGAVCVSLGPRILRTETAGLCCLSLALSAMGEI